MRYAKDMFSFFLPEATPLHPTIDRIHRLPKPPYLPENIPCDDITRIHFFHIKEQLLVKSRSLTLSSTLCKHPTVCSLHINPGNKETTRYSATITISLYKWGNPTMLTI